MPPSQNPITMPSQSSPHKPSPHTPLTNPLLTMPHTKAAHKPSPHNAPSQTSLTMSPHNDLFSLCPPLMISPQLISRLFNCVQVWLKSKVTHGLHRLDGIAVSGFQLQHNLINSFKRLMPLGYT
nr:hypothetical protein BgiMline_004322 [Biomphalaria glabrata]